MTLVLQIENYSALDDGGPVQFTVPAHGAQIGRSKSMDWTLPDPTRHISSHHFDIVVQNGVYYLRDVSTNGTFLQGSRYRIDGLHQLNNGDRFQVGAYFIVAMLQAPVNQGLQVPTGFTSPPNAPAPSWDDASDPWDVGGPAEPIDPLPPRPGSRANDFADDFIDLPKEQTGGLRRPPSMADTAFAEPAPLKTPTLAPRPSAAPVQAPPGRALAPSPQASPAPVPQADTGPVAPIPSVPRPELGQREAVNGVATPHPAQSAPHAPLGPQAAGQDAFVQAFCEAAGLSSAQFSDKSGVELARAMGKTTRILATEIMMLLKARSSTKQFTRGGARTMPRKNDNNPLKFLPDEDQAIIALFFQKRDGFLDGPDGVAEAMRDIRTHQMAVFAAMQPALAALLEGLSPEEIDDSGGGLMIGSGKRGKAWDTFVERWDAKASPHDNGMLDEFLKHFAKAYGEVVDSSDS